MTSEPSSDRASASEPAGRYGNHRLLAPPVSPERRPTRTWTATTAPIRHANRAKARQPNPADRLALAGPLQAPGTAHPYGTVCHPPQRRCLSCVQPVFTRLSGTDEPDHRQCAHAGPPGTECGRQLMIDSAEIARPLNDSPSCSSWATREAADLSLSRRRMRCVPGHECRSSSGGCRRNTTASWNAERGSAADKHRTDSGGGVYAGLYRGGRTRTTTKEKPMVAWICT